MTAKFNRWRLFELVSGIFGSGVGAVIFEDHGKTIVLTKHTELLTKKMEVSK